MQPQVIGSVLMARHGETPSNVARRYAGWSDEALTERGQGQARALAAELRGKGITRVRTSVIARAVQTGSIVAEALGLPVLEDERLNELRMGPWEGLTDGEVERDYPDAYRVWLERPDQLRLDGRETLDHLVERVSLALEDSVRSGETEMLISHVALVRVAILLGAGGSLSEYKQIPVYNCQSVRVPVWRNGGNGKRDRTRSAVTPP